MVVDSTARQGGLSFKFVILFAFFRFLNVTIHVVSLQAKARSALVSPCPQEPIGAIRRSVTQSAVLSTTARRVPVLLLPCAHHSLTRIKRWR